MGKRGTFWARFVYEELNRNKRATKHLPRRWSVPLKVGLFSSRSSVYRWNDREFRSYTVIATAWLQVPLVPPLTVMAAPVDGVRMTVKVEGPPQLIPITVRV